MLARTISIKKEIAQAIKSFGDNETSPLPALENIRYIDSPAELENPEDSAVIISTNETTNYEEISHGTHIAKVPVNVDVFVPNNPMVNERLVELIASAILKDRTLGGNVVDIKLFDTEARKLAGHENVQVLMFQFEAQVYLRAQNAS